ncbi:hypothetical protein SH657_004560 [Salmonella enterica]|nr:hypothetical protein [Salmonella enterica]
MFHTIVSIKNDGHYFCRAGGNRPDGLNEPVTNNLLSVLNLVLEGKGINLMTPAWLATKYLKNNELEIILPEWRVPDLPIYLVWRHRQYYSPLFQRFLSFIEDKWNNRPQIDFLNDD